jgi:hypothetical protein
VPSLPKKKWGSVLREVPQNKMDFLKDEGGQISTIMTLVTGAITLVLGVIIFANVVANIPAVNDSNATAVITGVSSIFYSSANLVVIGFIVLAAVFILSVVQRLRE